MKLRYPFLNKICSVVVPHGQKQEFHNTDTDTPVIEAKSSNENNFFQSIRALSSDDEYVEMNFWKDRDNQVTLHPDKAQTHATVDAHFNISNQLKNFPSTYNNYRVIFLENATVTTEDINAIFKWHAAKEIKLFDESGQSDVALSLYRRVSEFNATNLESLSFVLHRKACAQIDVTPFFQHLPKLNTIHFYGNIFETVFTDLHIFEEMVEDNPDLKMDKQLLQIVITRKPLYRRVFNGAKKFFQKLW